MASLPIHWMVARAYCQATEEEDRVVQALETALPGALEAQEKLQGQFGNPLVAITGRIERSEAIRTVWERWCQAGLGSTLRDDLEGRVDDDGVLHFRLDKQTAFAGELIPAKGADAIDVQVKLKAYPAKREGILKVARALLAEAD